MQFEWNARTQITMWFDNSDDEASLLRDYGTKMVWLSDGFSFSIEEIMLFLFEHVGLFLQETNTGAGFYEIITALERKYTLSS